MFFIPTGLAEAILRVGLLEFWESPFGQHLDTYIVPMVGAWEIETHVSVGQDQPARLGRKCEFQFTFSWDFNLPLHGVQFSYNNVSNTAFYQVISVSTTRYEKNRSCFQFTASQFQFTR